MNHGYILLADDSDGDRELARLSLQDALPTTELFEVADGAEVVHFLHRRGKFSSRPPQDPIVVLLDIKLPKLNGIEVLGVMKKDPSLCHIPVVMLSSSRQNLDLKACYDLKANAYVVKPVDSDKFADYIKVIGKFWAEVNQLPNLP